MTRIGWTGPGFCHSCGKWMEEREVHSNEVPVAKPDSDDGLMLVGYRHKSEVAEMEPIPAIHENYVPLYVLRDTGSGVES